MIYQIENLMNEQKDKISDEDKEKIQKLIKALQSEKVKKYIDEKYNGSVVAAF